MVLLITGGLGFIGSCLVRYERENYPNDRIIVLDKITYAGRSENIAGVRDVIQVYGDICDAELVSRLLRQYSVDAVLNLAAESHVDNSISSAVPFVQTNVVGVQTLLACSLEYGLNRFLQISTDEVFGDLDPGDEPFTEDSPLRPNSPYAASKAAADCLVRSYVRTHGLPAIITRCTNNYGPRQHAEKLIPRLVLRALAGETLPVYGDGHNIRDWIHVRDHCRAIDLVLRKGYEGETYCIGAREEHRNVDIAKEIIRIVGKGTIEYVADRPGHDRRYAIDPSKIERDLGWLPQRKFEAGLRETVLWYRDNETWWRDLVSRGKVEA